MQKIAQRKRYIRKQKGNTVSSKDDELDLLGDDVESFTGSNADLESAADNLFTSPPRPLVSGIASIFAVDYSSNFPTDDRPIIDFFTPL